MCKHYFSCRLITNLLCFPPHEERRMYLFRIASSNRWKNTGNSLISKCEGLWSSYQTADWRKINSKQKFLKYTEWLGDPDALLYSGHFGSFLGVKCPEHEAIPLLPWMTSCCAQQNHLQHRNSVVLQLGPLVNGIFKYRFPRMKQTVFKGSKTVTCHCIRYKI
jgi:hypothetical protein